MRSCTVIKAVCIAENNSSHRCGVSSAMQRDKVSPFCFQKQKLNKPWIGLRSYKYLCIRCCGHIFFFFFLPHSSALANIKLIYSTSLHRTFTHSHTLSFSFTLSPPCCHLYPLQQNSFFVQRLLMVSSNSDNIVSIHTATIIFDPIFR